MEDMDGWYAMKLRVMVHAGSHLRDDVAALHDTSHRRRFECWCCGGKRCSGIVVPPRSLYKDVQAAEIQVEGTRTCALIDIGAVFCAVGRSFMINI